MIRKFSGLRLREARRAADLKPEQLAVRIDRSVYSILEYERGRALPSIGVLASLASVLDRSTDYFFIDEQVSSDAAA